MHVICGEKDSEYGRLIAFWGAAPFIQQLSVPHFLERETNRARFLMLKMWLKPLAEFCDIANPLLKTPKILMLSALLPNTVRGTLSALPDTLNLSGACVQRIMCKLMGFDNWFERSLGFFGGNLQNIHV